MFQTVEAYLSIRAEIADRSRCITGHGLDNALDAFGYVNVPCRKCRHMKSSPMVFPQPAKSKYVTDAEENPGELRYCHAPRPALGLAQRPLFLACLLAACMPAASPVVLHCPCLALHWLASNPSSTGYPHM